MKEYFRKIGVIKTAITEIRYNVDKIKPLEEELSRSTTQSQEKDISMTLNTILDRTYTIIAKTKTAIELIKHENINYYYQCPSSLLSSTRPIDYNSTNPIDPILHNIHINVNASNSSIIKDRGKDWRCTEGRGDSEGGSSCEYRIRMNLHLSISMAFKDVVKNFQSAQSDYNDVARRRCFNHIKNVYPDAPDSQIHLLMTRGPQEAVEDVSNTKFNMGLKHFESAQLHLYTTYHDLRKIQKNFMEVHNILSELSILVDQQTEFVNQIQETTEDTKTRTDKANKDLYEAHEYQQASRQQMCGVSAILLVLLFLVISSHFSRIF